MSIEHTVKSFDEELNRLSQMVAQMGGLAEAQLHLAIEALVARRDAAQAGRVVQDDSKIDLSSARFRPTPSACWPCASPWPRICARSSPRSRSPATSSASATTRPTSPSAPGADPEPAACRRPVGGIARMGRLVQQIIKDVLDAYTASATRTRRWRSGTRDEDVDDMYNSLFRELLTYMMEDPRTISACSHLMFIAKNIERIGDHATNIAEIVHFVVPGEDIAEAAPQGRPTSFDRDQPAGGQGMKHDAADSGRRGRSAPSSPCCATISKRRVSASPRPRDGEEALLQIAEQHARPGAARLDAALMSGIEVCRQLRAPARDPRPAHHHADRPRRRRRQACAASIPAPTTT